MSIIIKSDEVNILIYKYLQQCNLIHTAYTFFTEANIQQSFTQYKYDVKSGHLISLLQKALIFSQIQSHITINDCQQCKQPFYLLKQHVCKITQQIKQQKQALLQQMNQKIFSTMRRTSSVHNTLQPNRDFEYIIYQQRSANFFDKIPIKINNADEIQIKMSSGQFQQQKYICALDIKTQTMTQIIIKNDNFIQTVGIIPCQQKIKIFELKDQLLIQVFQNNSCQIIKISNNGFLNQILYFKLPLVGLCTEIKPNKKLKNIIAFQNQQQFCIININTKRSLIQNMGKIQWVGYFEYLVLDRKNKKITKYSLKTNIDENPKQFQYFLNNPINIKVSFTSIYFFIQSIVDNQVVVYNFDQSKPLYIFDLQQSEDNGQINDQLQIHQKLQQVLWVTSNSTDNLILLTNLSIKTFQIQLNNFSKIIQISSYDTQIKTIQRLKKNQDNMYIVGQGIQNLIFYDIGLGKIQRIQYAQNNTPKQIFEFNDYHVIGINIKNKIILLQSYDIQPLFL